VSSLFIALG